MHQDLVWAQGGDPVWSKPVNEKWGLSPKGTVPISNNTLNANIIIPKDVAVTKEVYNSPLRNTQYAERKTIINIQDAHASLSAQESISSILDSLVTNYDLKLVAIEGSSGYIDTSILKTFPDESIRKDTAKELMSQGKMSAGEFFTITSSKPIKLYGIEDKDLYLQNVDQFRKVYELNQATKKDIDNLIKILESLKDKLYTPELRQLESNSVLHEDGKITFTDRWLYLSNLAQKLNSRAHLSVPYQSYSNLSKLVESLKLEKEISFTTANKERDSLIDELSKKLSKQSLEELVLKSLSFKTNKISQTEYYSYLQDQANKAGIDPRPYKNLIDYTEYITLYESIDLFEIFNEVKAYEDTVIEKLYTTEDQRKLHEISRCVGYIRDLFNLKLTNADFEYLEKHLQPCNKDYISDFLSRGRLNVPYTVDNSAGYNLDTIFTNLDTAMSFYRTAEQRNQAILQNTIRQMDKDGAEVAALITGGYHTKGISDLLKQKQTSYLVILPKFDASKGQRPYVAILTNRNDNYSERVRSLFKEIVKTTLDKAYKENRDIPALKKLWKEEYRANYEKLINQGMTKEGVGYRVQGIGKENPEKKYSNLGGDTIAVGTDFPVTPLPPDTAFGIIDGYDPATGQSEEIALPPYVTSESSASYGYADVGNVGEYVYKNTGRDTPLEQLKQEVTSGAPIQRPEYYVPGRKLNEEEQRIAAGFIERLDGHFGKPWRGPGAPAINHFILNDYIFFLTLLITDYYNTGIDSYASVNNPRISHGVNYLKQLRESGQDVESIPPSEAIKALAKNILYANRFEGMREVAAQDLDSLEIVSDYRNEFAKGILSVGPGGILDMFVDNIGPELCANLQFMHYLLSHGLVGKVRLHIKSEPTVISDVWGREGDAGNPHIQGTLDALKNSGDGRLVELANGIESRLDNTILIQRDEFLIRDPDFAEIAGKLNASMPDSKCAIFMGDYLYLKLFGNRQWPHTQDMADIGRILDYIDAPVGIIRMIKAPQVKLGAPKDSPSDNTVGMIQFFPREASPASPTLSPASVGAPEKIVFETPGLSEKDIPDSKPVLLYKGRVARKTQGYEAGIVIDMFPDMSMELIQLIHNFILKTYDFSNIGDSEVDIRIEYLPVAGKREAEENVLKITILHSELNAGEWRRLLEDAMMFVSKGGAALMERYKHLGTSLIDRESHFLYKFGNIGQATPVLLRYQQKPETSQTKSELFVSLAKWAERTPPADEEKLLTPKEFLEKAPDGLVGITGATGFLGSQLVKSNLARSAPTAALVNPSSANIGKIPVGADNLYVMPGDLSNYEALDAMARKSRTLYHLGAISDFEDCAKDWAQTLMTNTWATAEIAALAQKYDKRLVFASTFYVYMLGGKASGEKVSETDILPVNKDLKAWIDKCADFMWQRAERAAAEGKAPDQSEIRQYIESNLDELRAVLKNDGRGIDRAIYPVSKLIAEKFIQKVQNGIVFRIGNTYGPGQDRYKVPLYYRDISKLAPGETYQVWPDTRVFMYVGDWVRAAEAAGTMEVVKGENDIINIGGEETVGSVTLARTIADIVGKAASLITLDESKKDVRKPYILDTARQKKYLNIGRLTTLRRGLQETIVYLSQNKAISITLFLILANTAAAIAEYCFGLRGASAVAGMASTVAMAAFINGGEGEPELSGIPEDQRELVHTYIQRDPDGFTLFDTDEGIGITTRNRDGVLARIKGIMADVEGLIFAGKIEGEEARDRDGNRVPVLVAYFNIEDTENRNMVIDDAIRTLSLNDKIITSELTVSNYSTSGYCAQLTEENFKIHNPELPADRAILEQMYTLHEFIDILETTKKKVKEEIAEGVANASLVQPAIEAIDQATNDYANSPNRKDGITCLAQIIRSLVIEYGQHIRANTERIEKSTSSKFIDYAKQDRDNWRMRDRALRELWFYLVKPNENFMEETLHIRALTKDICNDKPPRAQDSLILFVDTLTPRDLNFILERYNVQAIVTQSATMTSHWVVYAGDRGIPVAIIGAGEGRDFQKEISSTMNRIRDAMRSGRYLENDINRRMALVGGNGEVVIGPHLATVEQYLERLIAETALNQIEAEEAPVKCDRVPVGNTGRAISLRANADNVEEVKKAKAEYSAAGIGLFRTEYLFTGAESLIKIKNYLNAYFEAEAKGDEESRNKLRVATNMMRRGLNAYFDEMTQAAGGDPIKIRTIDYEPDKITEIHRQLADRKIPGKNFGMDFYRTKLGRAILLVELEAAFSSYYYSPKKNIKMIFPMVRTIDDTGYLREIFEEARDSMAKQIGGQSKEKEDEARAKLDLLPVELMIEHPDAVDNIEAFVRLDWISGFSIGTNDLWRYILSKVVGRELNRDNHRDNALLSRLHPECTKAITKVIAAVRDENRRQGRPAKEISFCGELASHQNFLVYLAWQMHKLGIGDGELPVSLSMAGYTIRPANIFLKNISKNHYDDSRVTTFLRDGHDEAGIVFIEDKARRVTTHVMQKIYDEPGFQQKKEDIRKRLAEISPGTKSNPPAENRTLYTLSLIMDTGGAIAELPVAAGLPKVQNEGKAGPKVEVAVGTQGSAQATSAVEENHKEFRHFKLICYFGLHPLIAKGMMELAKKTGVQLYIIGHREADQAQYVKYLNAQGKQQPVKVAKTVDLMQNLLPTGSYFTIMAAGPTPEATGAFFRGLCDVNEVYDQDRSVPDSLKKQAFEEVQAEEAFGLEFGMLRIAKKALGPFGWLYNRLTSPFIEELFIKVGPPLVIYNLTHSVVSAGTAAIVLGVIFFILHVLNKEPPPEAESRNLFVKWYLTAKSLTVKEYFQYLTAPLAATLAGFAFMYFDPQSALWSSILAHLGINIGVTVINILYDWGYRTGYRHRTDSYQLLAPATISGGNEETDKVSLVTRLNSKLRLDMLTEKEKDELLKAMSHLKENQQKVAMLRVWDNKTFKEIGVLLKISSVWAQVVYGKAMKQLRSHFAAKLTEQEKKKMVRDVAMEMRARGSRFISFLLAAGIGAAAAMSWSGLILAILTCGVFAGAIIVNGTSRDGRNEPVIREVLAMIRANAIRLGKSHEAYPALSRVYNYGLKTPITFHDDTKLFVSDAEIGLPRAILKEKTDNAARILVLAGLKHIMRGETNENIQAEAHRLISFTDFRISEEEIVEILNRSDEDSKPSAGIIKKITPVLLAATGFGFLATQMGASWLDTHPGVSGLSGMIAATFAGGILWIAMIFTGQPSGDVPQLTKERIYELMHIINYGAHSEREKAENELASLDEAGKHILYEIIAPVATNDDGTIRAWGDSWYAIQSLRFAGIEGLRLAFHMKVDPSNVFMSALKKKEGMDPKKFKALIEDFVDPTSLKDGLRDIFSSQKKASGQFLLEELKKNNPETLPHIIDIIPHVLLFDRLSLKSIYGDGADALIAAFDGLFAGDYPSFEEFTASPFFVPDITEKDIPPLLESIHALANLKRAIGREAFKELVYRWTLPHAVTWAELFLKGSLDKETIMLAVKAGTPSEGKPFQYTGRYNLGSAKWFPVRELLDAAQSAGRPELVHRLTIALNCMRSPLAATVDVATYAPDAPYTEQFLVSAAAGIRLLESRRMDETIDPQNITYILNSKVARESYHFTDELLRVLPFFTTAVSTGDGKEKKDPAEVMRSVTAAFHEQYKNSCDMPEVIRLFSHRSFKRADLLIKLYIELILSSDTENTKDRDAFNSSYHVIALKDWLMKNISALMNIGDTLRDQAEKVDAIVGSIYDEKEELLRWHDIISETVKHFNNRPVEEIGSAEMERFINEQSLGSETDRQNVIRLIKAYQALRQYYSFDEAGVEENIRRLDADIVNMANLNTAKSLVEAARRLTGLRLEQHKIITSTEFEEPVRESYGVEHREPPKYDLKQKGIYRTYSEPSYNAYNKEIYLSRYHAQLVKRYIGEYFKNNEVDADTIRARNDAIQDDIDDMVFMLISSLDALELSGILSQNMRRLKYLLEHAGLSIGQLRDIAREIRKDIADIYSSYDSTFGQVAQDIVMMAGRDKLSAAYRELDRDKKAPDEDYAVKVRDTLVGNVLERNRIIDALDCLAGGMEKVSTILIDDGRSDIRINNGNEPPAMLYMRSDSAGQNKVLLSEGGNKAAHLMELKEAGFPVPPFFYLSARLARDRGWEERLTKDREELELLVLDNILWLEKEAGKTFPFSLKKMPYLYVDRIRKARRGWLGDGKTETAEPLLVSVRSSPFAPMLGILDTILDVPMNRALIDRFTGAGYSKGFGCNTMISFLETYAAGVLHIKEGVLREELEKYKKEIGKESVRDFSDNEMEKVVDMYIRKIAQVVEALRELRKIKILAEVNKDVYADIGEIVKTLQDIIDLVWYFGKDREEEVVNTFTERASGKAVAVCMSYFTDRLREINEVRWHGDDNFQVLMDSIRSTFKSWNSVQANSDRAVKNISGEWQTPVIVQEMVYGNKDRRSYTMSVSSDDEISGLGIPNGSVKQYAQGMVLKSGVTSTAWAISDYEVQDGKRKSLQAERPDIYAMVVDVMRKLRRYNGGPCEAEITVEEGAKGPMLYVLQCIPSLRGKYNKLAVKPEGHIPAAVGVGITGGAAQGRLLSIEGKTYEQVIKEIALLRKEMDGKGEDKRGIIVILNYATPAQGNIFSIPQVTGAIMWSEGTGSHAAVAARRPVPGRPYGIPVVGGLKIELGKSKKWMLRVDSPEGPRAVELKEGAEGLVVTIDGNRASVSPHSGHVYLGEVPLIGIDKSAGSESSDRPKPWTRIAQLLLVALTLPFTMGAWNGNTPGWLILLGLLAAALATGYAITLYELHRGNQMFAAELNRRMERAGKKIGKDDISCLIVYLGSAIRFHNNEVIRILLRNPVLRNKVLAEIVDRIDNPKDDWVIDALKNLRKNPTLWRIFVTDVIGKGYKPKIHMERLQPLLDKGVHKSIFAYLLAKKKAVQEKIELFTVIISVPASASAEFRQAIRNTLGPTAKIVRNEKAFNAETSRGTPGIILTEGMSIEEVRSENFKLYAEAIKAIAQDKNGEKLRRFVNFIKKKLQLMDKFDIDQARNALLAKGEGASRYTRRMNAILPVLLREQQARLAKVYSTMTLPEGEFKNQVAVGTTDAVAENDMLFFDKVIKASGKGIISPIIYGEKIKTLDNATAFARAGLRVSGLTEGRIDEVMKFVMFVDSINGTKTRNDIVREIQAEVFTRFGTILDLYNDIGIRVNGNELINVSQGPALGKFVEIKPVTINGEQVYVSINTYEITLDVVTKLKGTMTLEGLNIPGLSIDNKGRIIFTSPIVPYDYNKEIGVWRDAIILLSSAA